MARQTRARSRSTSRTSYQTGTIEIFSRPRRNPYIWVLGLLLRLRAEILVGIALVTVTVELNAQIGSTPTVITLGSTTVLILVIPTTRRFVLRRMWCVNTRHRMRACFSSTRTMTHDGRMPLLLWSRPSPTGERVRVWLPAGLSVKDIDAVALRIAAACWAREARVIPTRSQAALVIVDVVRRDPLSGSEFSPSLVDDLDMDGDPYGPDDRTVVTLPSRATTPRRTADRTTAAPHTSAPVGPNRTTAAKATATKAVRRPLDDEDADPSL